MNKIEGYSIQNGEPTPDNPVEIESLELLEKFNPGDEYTEKIKIAIENILAEREQDKARIQELQDMLKEKDKEIEKKDKIIDLIIDFFYKLTQESPGTTIHYLEKNGFDTSKCNNCSPGNDCRKCFKQYFERKVKDGRL